MAGLVFWQQESVTAHCVHNIICIWDTGTLDLDTSNLCRAMSVTDSPIVTENLGGLLVALMYWLYYWWLALLVVDSIGGGWKHWWLALLLVGIIGGWRYSNEFGADQAAYTWMKTLQQIHAVQCTFNVLIVYILLHWMQCLILHHTLCQWVERCQIDGVKKSYFLRDSEQEFTSVQNSGWCTVVIMIIPWALALVLALVPVPSTGTGWGCDYDNSLSSRTSPVPCL